MIYHFFFFFFLAPASFSIFTTSLILAISCFCKNYYHSWSNCSFFDFIFSSIASALSFFVCLFSSNTPEISYSLLIRFLSINSIYRSSSCYCLFAISLFWMAITSSRSISGLFSMSSLNKSKCTELLYGYEPSLLLTFLRLPYLAQYHSNLLREQFNSFAGPHKNC